MNGFTKGIGASLLACAMAMGNMGTGFAAQVRADPPSVQNDVVQAQSRHYRRDRDHRRHRDRWERRGNSYYLNGHRGYKHRRQGYREYNGWWFPSAAFVAGAIIGGAVANSGPRSNAHVQWCANRYRSYRVSDDTFQPYNGPRQRCVSPY